MEEVKLQGMPHHVREVFAFLLLFTQIPDNEVHSIWDEYLPSMREDFERDRAADADTRTWVAVQQIMADHGKRLDNDFDIPCPGVPVVYPEPHVPDLTTWDMLNVEQRAVAERVLAAALSQQSGAFFVDGPGGTGKTFTYNAIYHKLRSLDISVICVASTGIASTLLEGGMTAHKRFGLPFHVSLQKKTNMSCACM